MKATGICVTLAVLAAPVGSFSLHRQIITSRPPSQLALFGPEVVEDLSNAWTAYNVALETDPLLTKSVTAGVILGAADLAGQALENRMAELDKDVDWARAARFAFFGFVLQAPWNHFYYIMLDGALPPTPDPLTATTGIKVVIDQFVQAPIFTVLIFGFLGTLEGKSVDDIKRQLEADYTDTMVANCEYTIEGIYWIPHCPTSLNTCDCHSTRREALGSCHIRKHCILPSTIASIVLELRLLLLVYFP